MSQVRYEARKLTEYVSLLLEKAGLQNEPAAAVAQTLVEGDLLGHSTHGLALLPAYLDELNAGKMTKVGDPHVIADFPAAITWDGMRLPGPWLLKLAIDQAILRARTLGTCTVAIRRSHHTACLAAYLKRVTDEGLMIILCSSDPAFTGVAPHGGAKGALSPNPIAAGWPTRNGPVFIDVSMSIASMGTVRRAHERGATLPGNWLLDNQGNPTNDPATRFADPPGSMLPIGGIDHGHKGYALALLVEALSIGLAGHGRADPAEGWSNNVWLQILNPAMFGGLEDFLKQTTWVAEACRNTPRRERAEPVRLPGEAGLKRRAQQLQSGIELSAAIVAGLESSGTRFNVTLPDAFG